MAAIWALFGEHEEISASLVAGALGLSARRVREILQQLTDVGVLTKQSDRRIELSLDVLNLTNLISRSWGLVHRTSNWALSPVVVTELREVEGGYRPVYEFKGAQYTVDDVMSRWHMQLGVRVVF